ncbi:hypothetical protein [Roseovarius sp. MBR-6]|jgi:hypothetical protein|uniref:hypothetical protein n=1 Tax=Roseovarius sp. MBR-6 TaxID=3156459 RepID=UPI003393FA52
MTDESKTVSLCDEIVYRAACLMIEEAGADIVTVLDRLLTYSAAQAVSMDGAQDTAAIFRHLADRIEAGAFASLEGKRGKVN